MFNVGSKITVIGSPYKSKSSPRIGSVGYILNIKPPILVYIHNLLCYESKASIIFTRYGYQNKSRFELKNVYIIVPKNFSEESNINKTLNSVINLVKNKKRKHKKNLGFTAKEKNLSTIVVAPLIEKYNFDDINDISGAILSRLLNVDISRILYKATLLKTKSLKSAAKIRYIIKPKTTLLVRTLYNFDNLYTLKQKLMEFDITTLKNFICVTSLIKAMQLREFNLKIEDKGNLFLKNNPNIVKLLYKNLFNDDVYLALLKSEFINKKVKYWKKSIKISSILRNTIKQKALTLD